MLMGINTIIQIGYLDHRKEISPNVLRLLSLSPNCCGMRLIIRISVDSVCVPLNRNKWGPRYGISQVNILTVAMSQGTTPTILP